MALTQSAQFRQALAAAPYASSLGPIKKAIRASALTLDEQAALIQFAQEREDAICTAYLGRTIYTGRNSNRS